MYLLLKQFMRIPAKIKRYQLVLGFKSAWVVIGTMKIGLWAIRFLYGERPTAAETGKNQFYRRKDILSNILRMCKSFIDSQIGWVFAKMGKPKNGNISDYLLPMMAGKVGI
jgi:uncharacterized membrane protein YbjE (DUF340 family)